MANPVWPGSLPQFVDVSNYQEKLPFAALRTNMDRGPAKQRRVSTAVASSSSYLTDIMNPTQRDTFLDFYINTLAQGTLAFDWVDPLTQDVQTFRFTDGPQPQPLGGGYVQYQLPMEKMP